MILFLSNLVIAVFEINNSKQLDKVGKMMQIHRYYLSNPLGKIFVSGLMHIFIIHTVQ